MSNFWRVPKARILPIAALLLPLTLHAGPYAELDARLSGKPDVEAVEGLRRLAKGDAEAKDALGAGPKSARAYIGLRASLENDGPAKLPPIGVGPGQERVSSSWLGRALSRLRAPSFDFPRSSGPPTVAVGPWATFLMWGLLALLGGFAVFLLARYVRLPGLKRRSKAMVDDSEPERTADAWLSEADALIAQGRFREAVRGLYVAGLLRFDEAGVARFDRNQTNWEHLRRIESSPKTPTGTETREATGRFDRVWYGHLPVGSADATAMRAWYDGLVGRLTDVASA